jgi:4-hydroxy-tetrahydrodipicolinate reductase
MKISVIGCTGRMGLAIIEEIAKDSNLSLVGGFGKYKNQLSKVNLGELINNNNINIYSSKTISEATLDSDIIIDFSLPSLSLQAAKIAAQKKKIFVSGTTGFTDQDFTKLQSYAQDTTIIWSSNMSIGVNLLNILIARSCDILGEDFDTEILEMHHKFKKDSPSGTAISLGKTIAKAKKLNFNEVAKLSREGNDLERKANEIGFATLRGGSVIGDHKVIFASEEERIEISHKAVNRNIFAKGAIRAAKWAYKNGKKKGFYSITDVLTS